MSDEQAERNAVTFSYERPETLPDTDSPKSHAMLANENVTAAEVQIIQEGEKGSTLHSHKDMDGFWMPLKGEARFYTVNDEVIGELSEYEGILIPQDFPYWHENAGDGELELLHVLSFDPQVERDSQVDEHLEGKLKSEQQYLDGNQETIPNPRKK